MLSFCRKSIMQSLTERGILLILNSPNYMSRCLLFPRAAKFCLQLLRFFALLLALYPAGGVSLLADLHNV